MPNNRWSSSESVNTGKFPFKIAVATATVRYMSFSLDLIFKNYNYLFNAGHVVIQYQPLTMIPLFISCR